MDGLNIGGKALKLKTNKEKLKKKTFKQHFALKPVLY